MKEISLHILDAAENSLRAGASLISILVWVDERNDCLTTVITDDGKGMTEETLLTAVFSLSCIDRMPLGDINSTIETLILCHPDKNFFYTYRFNEAAFELDTRSFRKILLDIPLNEPEISAFIKEYLRENKSEIDGDAAI